MHVQLIDPSAFTPPYDRALARSLAEAGAEVELITSRFLYGPVPEAAGYEVTESFYRRSSARGLEARGRVPFKFAEHLGDMRRLRSRIAGDVTHYQWLTVPSLDRHLISPKRPRVMTAHYVIAPEPSSRQIRSARKVFEAMDAVIVHSATGARRMNEIVGLPEDRIRVIPHGSFDYLTELPDEKPLPPELEGAQGPVILFFGLMRPYKGIDLLLDAFAEVEGAELWIVGNPRMDIEPLKAKSDRLPGTVRWLPRFVHDDEIPAIMRRADLLVLPYRDGEQSGVLYTGLAFGKPMVVSNVGGLGDVAREHDAALLVEPGDVAGLGSALETLVADESARSALAGKAAAAAEGPFAWGNIAEMTLDLYREVGA
ncbi:MAG TPA: glycosyltransferase family 4 protein [Solirubrobacterales bacterium]|nr:glycosyltransferase family 4 protein [Solirubrobacterales bacterium]